MIVWIALLLGNLHQHASALPRPKKWGEDRVVYQHDKPWDGNSYSYGFQTLFGSSRKEKAVLKKDTLGEDYIDVEGEYTYPSPDGSIRRVSYRANLLGYQASEDSIRIHSNLDNTVTNTGTLIQNMEHKFALDTQNTAVVADTSNNLNLEVAAGTNNHNFETHEITSNNNSIVDDIKVKHDNMSIVKLPDKIKNNDIIHFPSDQNEVTLTTSTQQHVLTTAPTPPIVAGVTNECVAGMTADGARASCTVGLGQTVDYYYDELGNRIGGVPPAVLGSLLG